MHFNKALEICGDGPYGKRSALHKVFQYGVCGLEIILLLHAPCHFELEEVAERLLLRCFREDLTEIAVDSVCFVIFAVLVENLSHF